MITFRLKDSPGSVEDEAREEDDEEVVGVPEDLKVAASDDLHGGGDDEDEGQSDDDPREAGDGGEDEVGWNLLRVLGHKEGKKTKLKTKQNSLLSQFNFFYRSVCAVVTPVNYGEHLTDTLA